MRITSQHFGGHLLITKDNPAPDSPFTRLTMDAFNHQYLRYPGGTVTEQLSHRDGSLDQIFTETDRQIDGSYMVSAHEAMRFADAQDIGLQWVMPTETFLTEGSLGTRTPDIDAIKAHIQTLITFFAQYPDVRIESIEIGNEYWYLGERMSAGEYGAIANVIAVELQSALTAFKNTPEGADWHEPAIAVQSGAGWRARENAIILNALGPEARSAIDMVVAHYYPGTFENTTERTPLFNNLEAFKNAPGFGPLKTFLSEWNIHNVDAGDKGFPQAYALIQAFDVILQNAIDYATVWGTNYRNLDTRLSGVDASSSGETPLASINTWLTPAGEVFRMMEEALIGKTRDPNFLAQHGLNSLPNTHAWAYSDSGQTIVFIASTSDTPQTLTLNPAAWGPTGSHAWAMTLGATDLPNTTRNEGDPLSPLSRANVDTLTLNDMQANGITLQPHGIVRIVLTTDPNRSLLLRGGDQNIGPEGTYADLLIGAHGHDTLEGNIGNDTLQSGRGHDVLSGGSGSDVLESSHGNDTLYGGTGTDVLRAHSGDDMLYGGDQDDWLYGGGNSDILYGDGGNDSLFGNTGTDLLYGGIGQDTLYGHSGQDTLNGDEDADLLFGGTDTDTIRGDSGNDVLYGGDHGDLLIGGSGHDSLYGDAGHDRLDGGSGRDVLHGNDGTDHLSDGLDNDVLFGGTSSDTLFGGEGQDRIHGDTGGDILHGGNGNDALFGGSGNDTLFGGNGTDRLDGGAGNDVLTGNGDSDLFVFKRGGGADTISDFNPQQGDMIGIDKTLFAPELTLEDVLATYAQSQQNGLLLTTPSGESLLILGIESLSVEQVVWL